MSLSTDAAKAGGELMTDSFHQRLRDFAVEFDQRFQAYLTPSVDVPPELVEAIRYSALAPGKRIRPYLVVHCCELVGGKPDDAWPVAAAVECVHAFSLVHDDLPAMDDDELRRGKPTCHKQFDEATAILAGDALVVLAFELVARHVNNPSLTGRIVLELAQGTGWAGMIGGQTADILGQSKPSTVDLARYIHERKTARLFETACRLGAMVGYGESGPIAALGRFGQRLGCAFQIADDLLDLSASARTLGKGVGKDVKACKQGFPQSVGIDESRAAAREMTEAAIAELEPFGSDADDLRTLAAYVLKRDY